MICYLSKVILEAHEKADSNTLNETLHWAGKMQNETCKTQGISKIFQDAIAG